MAIEPRSPLNDRTRRRVAEGSIVLVASMLLSGCHAKIAELDQYGAAELPVSGTITSADGRAVVGATVGIMGVENHGEPCVVATQGYGGATQSVADGTFYYKLQMAPITSAPVCVTLWIAPPPGSLLADTTISGVRAAAIDPRLGAPSNTLRLAIVLRSK